MVYHKASVFGVNRKMVGGKMRVVDGPRHRYTGGKMRWMHDSLHKSNGDPYTVENPTVRNSLFKDNEKNMTGSGSGSLSSRLAREYKHFMGSHSGSEHKHHRKHKSSMSGRGMHVY